MKEFEKIETKIGYEDPKMVVSISMCSLGNSIRKQKNFFT